MKDILVKDIVKVTGGELVCGNAETVCENFYRDSRIATNGDVYLGIKGKNFHGSTFYKEALENGATGCIIQDIEISEEDINTYKNKFIVKVKDVVKALGQIAEYKRSLYNIPVIGITGSVGKTSTKDIIAGVMETKYNVLKTDANHNNEIGLPLTILKLKEHDALVLEMGMSSFGEISWLTQISKPTTAVITVIGSSHIGELGSRENILKAKLEILEGLSKNGALIINNDNDLLNLWNKNNVDKHKHITYGIENQSNLVAKNIKVNENGTVFTAEIQGKEYTVKVPVAGKHFIYNSLAAIAVGLENNIKVEKIIQGIANFSLTKSRMEILKNKKNVTIINDCYNASYESVKAALEYTSTLKANKKIAVLGDVLELGDFSKQMHQKMGEEVINNNIDVLVTVGKEAKEIANTVLESKKNIEVHSFASNIDAISLLKEKMQENDVILVKASHGMHFEEIVDSIK